MEVNDLNFVVEDKAINEVKIPNSNFKKIDILYDACKSTLKIVSNSGLASGFFIKLEKNKSPFFCLMTNEHVISKKMIESKEDIEIYYDNQHKKLNINLDTKKRFIKEFSYLKIDITIVEIISEDEVSNDYFLLPNLDYLNGYGQFINKNIFIPQFPKGGSLNSSVGKIIEYNPILFDFSHSASTQEGSSGSPIFLEGSNLVLGIHKQANPLKIKNYGNFIGSIIDILKNEIKSEKKNYANGVYDGQFVNDMREGYGKFNYKDGHCYIGMWKNDVPTGKGTLYFNNKIQYIGDFFNDEFEGKGKLIFENGNYYAGEFSKGKFCGNGEYHYKNGRMLKGNFLNGDLNGKGFLYNKEGNLEYKGMFLNGKKEGEGKLYYPNGNYCKANFKNDKINGFGTLFKEDKCLIYKGEFLNNLKHGKGEYLDENGKYYIGEFLNDKKHGKGQLFYKFDGNIEYDGNFSKDYFEGKGT